MKAFIYLLLFTGVMNSQTGTEIKYNQLCSNDTVTKTFSYELLESWEKNKSAWNFLTRVDYLITITADDLIWKDRESGINTYFKIRNCEFLSDWKAMKYYCVRMADSKEVEMVFIPNYDEVYHIMDVQEVETGIISRFKIAKILPIRTTIETNKFIDRDSTGNIITENTKYPLKFEINFNPSSGSGYLTTIVPNKSAKKIVLNGISSFTVKDMIFYNFSTSEGFSVQIQAKQNSDIVVFHFKRNIREDNTIFRYYLKD